MKNKNNQNQNKEKPMRVKKLYGVEISEFELFCIRMICDYLFLDRFNDSASFIRFEQCFGPLFSLKNKDFKLVEAYREIIGKNKKYITFRRLIKAYINWKKKISNNYSFNYFMNEVFNNMIRKKGEVAGKLVEGERVFSTRNCKNRKIITKLSVQTDKTKNQINGFVIEYDEYFKAILCAKEKKEDINLEIHFNLFHSKEDKLGIELDRDGISHIAGKYEENSGIIKFLIFKCRSGKTMYIGDPSEKEGEKISPFIFGSSKCQLKQMKMGLIKDQLSYLQPTYQISTRINENLNINFDDLNEQYIQNDEPKFEEREYENATEEQIGTTEEDKKKFLFPLILDDQFVDKMNLLEQISGKSFKEIYKSYFEDGKPIEKFKEMMKIMLQDYLNKENREEKLRSEKKNLMDNLYYTKNNFDSVFVKLTKFKDKIKEKIGKEEEKDIEFMDEEEEEEDDKNLIKIKSGEFLVKGQNLPKNQNLRSNKAIDNKGKEQIKETEKEQKKEIEKEQKKEIEKEQKKEIEKEQKKEIEKEQKKETEKEQKKETEKEQKKEIEKEPQDSKVNTKHNYIERNDKAYNNHKVVEIKYTSKKNNKKEPQDSVKK